MYRSGQGIFLFLIIGAILSASAAVFCLLRKDKPGAAPFAVLMSGFALYLLSDSMTILNGTLYAEMLWRKIGCAGGVIQAPALFVFALQYRRKDRWAKRWFLIVLTVFPVVTLFLAWSNEMHEWVWRVTRSGLVPGVWRYVDLPFRGVLLSGAFSLIVLKIRQSPKSYKIEITAVSIAAAVLVFMLLPASVGAGFPNDHRLMTLVLTASGLLMIWGTYGRRTIGLSGQARKRLFERSGDALFVLDKNDCVVRFNAAAERMAGSAKDEIKGRHVSEVLNRCPDLNNQLNESVSGPVDVSCRDGDSRRHYEMNTTLLYDHEREITGKLLVLTDITRVKQATADLENIKNRFHTLLDKSHDLIVTADPKGRIIYTNRRWKKISGYSDEDSHDLDFESMIHPESLSRFRAVFPQVLQGESFEDEAFDFLTKDGAKLPVRANIAPEVRNNRLAAVHGVFRTVENEGFEPKGDDDPEGPESNAGTLEAIATLTGGVAHDFNNLLGTIIGYVETMELFDVPEDSPMRPHLDKVLDAAYQAENYVNQLQNIRGHMERRVQPVELSSFLKEALKNLKPFLPTGVACNQDIEPKTGSVPVDLLQFHLFFTSTIRGMFHESGWKSGLLEVTLKKKDIRTKPEQSYSIAPEPGTYLSLTVRCAPEIPQDGDPSRVTGESSASEPCAKSDETLAASSRIAEKNGWIFTKQCRTDGSRAIEVIWPKPEDDAVDRKEASFEQQTEGAECVLFVDDDESCVYSGREILEHLGYEVIGASSGKEAVKIFTKRPERFDLVVTDYSMPGMSGVELAEHVKKARPGTPVILCTGFGDDITEAECRRAGIEAFLHKPIGAVVLAEKVREVLNETLIKGE